MKTPNSDPQELDKFSKLASSWWDRTGPSKPLHEINPLRLQFIQKQVDLSGKTVLDIGCGGGILSEAMAGLGAQVTGLDLAHDSLEVARAHAKISQLEIDYVEESVEDFAQRFAGKFEVITCMEMLEHVPNPQSVLKACSLLLKPGGHLFVSTLNRTVKSFFQAIVGAEYILRLLPRGTHSYERFIKPSELLAWARPYQFECQDKIGLTYHPIGRFYSTTPSVEVNYILYLQKSDTP